MPVGLVLRAEKLSTPVQSTSSERVAWFEDSGHRRLAERVEDPLEHLGERAVRVLLPQRTRNEAERPLHLAVGEGVGASAPVDLDPEADPVGRIEVDQRLVHPDEVGGTAVTERHEHPDEQGARALVHELEDLSLSVVEADPRTPRRR